MQAANTTSGLSAESDFADAENQWANLRNELLRLIALTETRRKTEQTKRLNELKASLRNTKWEPEQH